MILREPDWHVARRAAAASRALPEETVDLADADRRTLGADVAALTDLPAFDTSAMDGWAVAGDAPWTLVGEVLAGRAPAIELLPGQACLIATGAAVPRGATAVVRREAGDVVGDRLAGAVPRPGADIRARGEECRVGDVLAEAGTRMNPGLLGSLAAAGHDRVRVRRAPRAAVVLFGDELVASGVPDVGRVRDALGPQLPGWLSRLGVDVASCEPAADTLDDHIAAIQAARKGVDLVITTGGTAAGPVDHLHTAVAALGGHLVVDAVAVRPGHPMALVELAQDDRSGARWLVALPGNPMSAVVSLLTLGAPLIASMLGRPPDVLGSVVLAQTVSAPPREHRLVPCILSGQQAEPTAHLGSAMLRGLAQATGFAVVPPGGADRDDRVGWLPLPQ